MENTAIEIVSMLGNPACVEADDGQIVFESIKGALAEGKIVTLSFSKVEMLAADFLTSAIGQLYREFPAQLIKENLRIEDLSLTGAVLLKRVVTAAKLQYKNPEILS